MTFHQLRTPLAIVAACGCLLTPMAAAAADPAERKPVMSNPPAGSVVAGDRMVYSDRVQMKDWTNEKDQLERDLKVGQGKAFYAKALADRGFKITSINADKADGVEYEVVKGNRTYEVQIEFDGTGKATDVDVNTNMWRAESTKAAMAGRNVPVATRMEAGNDRYSDRSRMKAWTDEKDRLEKALALGQDAGHYRDQLGKLGYQVTAVNDRERDYVEYEVVKGTNSYEVQIEMEAGKARDIDVTTNVWQAEQTERALNTR